MSKLLAIGAVVVFALALFGVGLGELRMVALGLALLAGAHAA